MDLNFGDFHLLDVIANILLKSSAFIRNLNMHLYQSNINLKIDISYSLPLYNKYILSTSQHLKRLVYSMLNTRSLS